jgi:hypothetical protein
VNWDRILGVKMDRTELSNEVKNEDPFQKVFIAVILSPSLPVTVNLAQDKLREESGTKGHPPPSVALNETKGLAFRPRVNFVKDFMSSFALPCTPCGAGLCSGRASSSRPGWTPEKDRSRVFFNSL